MKRFYAIIIYTFVRGYIHNYGNDMDSILEFKREIDYKYDCASSKLYNYLKKII